MRGHNKQDLSAINYTMISLLSNKVNILIVGGGEAALIKCRTFSKEGCCVTVVSQEFSKEFYEVQDVDNVRLIKDECKNDYVNKIIDINHIVIIATNNHIVNESIKNYCNEKCKLYLNCEDFTQGLVVRPVQGDTPNMKFALHTKSGSPKTSLFMSKIIEDKIYEYSDFIDYTCNIRDKVKGRSQKKEIMSFVCSEDFYFLYTKGAHNIILEMFYKFENDNVSTFRGDK